jgi:hypothetical protein
VDETTASDGRRSVRVDILAPPPHFPGTVLDIHSPDVPVEPGVGVLDFSCA